MVSSARVTLAVRLDKAVGPLTTATLAELEQDLPWFRELSAQDRSWIGLVAQQGIRSFVSWFRDPQHGTDDISAEVFGTAPTALARVVTLQQTVAMVRRTIDVVERNLDELLGPDDGALVRASMLHYSREIAFAAAEVYARTAEARGAWDARLEALVVDSVLRGDAPEAVRSRAAALGWTASHRVIVVLGAAPEGTRSSGSRPGGTSTPGVVDRIRRSARQADLEALSAVLGDRLVVVLGDVDDPDKAALTVSDHFGPGPIVVGPLVDGLLAASVSARAATAGLDGARGWPDAPRPVAADELWPERALAGDPDARELMVKEIYLPLLSGDGVLLRSVSAFVESGCSVEATARALFVHPNTVRYRLKRVAEVTGRHPADARDAFTLQIALTLGRLSRS